ncbi:MAG TPA: metallophosphoesterase [Bryobacteraceae bacterium]|nr:metallophosphoesterase [Bryobacteraceae bacterium]
MHDQLLAALLSVANVRLVASYTDSQLGFGGSDSIQVFIPDLHLLSAERRAHYAYGTNYEDTLVKVVSALVDLKNEAAQSGRRVVVFHIGDYLDLWRESLGPAIDPDVPDHIKDSHEQLVTLLEDPGLNTHFLLGNHDFDLCQLAGYNTWERRFFIPGTAPSVLVMHGDYFDWVERELPEELRDIGVYLFGESHLAGSAVLGQMQDLTHKYNQQCDYTSRIQLAAPAALGALQSGSAVVPASYNVQTKDSSVTGGLQFLDLACQECVNANAQFGSALRMVIIGHTHHARIATQSMPDGSAFALVDTGAWIENCAEADKGPEFPNAQITALSANQVRIYQLDPE